MGVQFVGKANSPITFTMAVTSKTGGGVKATFIWQNISDPTHPILIKEESMAVASSTVEIPPTDLAAAPAKMFSMLVSLISTDDATVWVWASQNDAPLDAFDDHGNAMPGEGPHKAVKAGAATKGKTLHIPVSVDLS